MCEHHNQDLLQTNRHNITLHRIHTQQQHIITSLPRDEQSQKERPAECGSGRKKQVAHKRVPKTLLTKLSIKWTIQFNQ